MISVSSSLVTSTIAASCCTVHAVTEAIAGCLKSDALNLSILGVNNKQAVKLMDRAGWQ